jgi:peptidoglycan/xylan/chitin deacetylase (PgdA/CDA1 family)
VLSLARELGLFRLSRYFRRNSRSLLILCYHGVSKYDEHVWKPSLYMAPELFQQHLRTVQEFGYDVLSLPSALEQIRNDSLTRPSVAITFDDGWHDFYTCAWPILKEFDYPATVYQTTYYSFYNRPVFDPCCSYLLWKARGQTLRDLSLVGSNVPLKLDSIERIDEATLVLRRHATNLGLSGEEKDGFLCDLAERLNVDFDAILSSRTLHLMNPAELAEVSRAKIDIQLHTHRHRLPADKGLFLAEITQNRELITKATGKRPYHFCYPNGAYRSEMPGWLIEAGVVSATTTDPGIASKASDRMLLPRVTDSQTVSQARFESWLSGAVLGRDRRRPEPALPHHDASAVKQLECDLSTEKQQARTARAG